LGNVYISDWSSQGQTTTQGRWGLEVYC
jgi:hypothetical protein